MSRFGGEGNRLGVEDCAGLEERIRKVLRKECRKRIEQVWKCVFLAGLVEKLTCLEEGT